MKKVIICISTFIIAILGFIGLKKIFRKDTEEPEYVDPYDYEFCDDEL